MEKLALLGGTPVRSRLHPYAHQTIDSGDIAAVGEALSSSLITQGPTLERFERALAARARVKHAVSFSSGTAALHGACWAAGLGPGDRAITTPLTFAATANAVVYQGARPVFADIDAATLDLDPDAVKRAGRGRVRAVLSVDFAGLPCDYDRLLPLAREKGWTVIADAAHSFGGAYGDRPVGALADMTTLSFHPAKLLTTGEGGAVLTDRDDLAERLRRFRNHGIATERSARTDWTYAMVDLGFNYRLSDIGAALGSSQLSRFDDFLARRRALADRYFERLGGHDLLDLPAVRPETNPAWHFMFIRLRLDLLRV